MTSGMKSLGAATAAAIGIALAPPAAAATITWTGTNPHNWFDPGNWSPASVPGIGDRAVINSGTPIASIFGSVTAMPNSIDLSGDLHVDSTAKLRLNSQNASQIRNGGLLLTVGAGSVELGIPHILTVFNGGTIGVIGGSFTNAARTGGGLFGSMLTHTGSNLDVLQIGRFKNQGTFTHRGTAIIGDTALFDNSGLGTTFNQQAGSVNVQSTQGWDNRSGAAYTKDSGTLNILNNSRFLNRGGATFTQTGGNTAVFGGGLFDNASNANLNGGALTIGATGEMRTTFQYTQNGGTLRVQSGGLFHNQGGTFSANLNGGSFIVEDGGNAVNDGDGFGPGGIVNNGANVVIDGVGVLSGIGTFVQHNGTTTVNGQMIQTGVTINGGTLGGSGTITSAVTVDGGTVGPGNSPGLLQVFGDMEFMAGSKLALELGGLLFGTGYDRLDVADDAGTAGTVEGTVSLAAGTLFDIDWFGAFTAGSGDYFDVLVADEFAAFDLTSMIFDFSGAALGTGLSWETGLVDFGGGREALRLSVIGEQVAEVPAPGMTLLFGLGLAGIGYARRRRAVRA